MEAWDFFHAGGALFMHLDYSFACGEENGTHVMTASTPGAGSPQLRHQFGILKKWIGSLDLVHVRADNKVVENAAALDYTARALVVPGRATAIYFRRKAGASSASTAPSIGLAPGTYRAEWLNPEDGRTLNEESFEHAGGSRPFPMPSRELPDLALRVVRKLR
jgi:hypothetical protein